MGSIGTNGVDKAEEQKMVGDDYLPTKDDIESAYRLIAMAGTWAKIDDVFDRLEANAKRAGIVLVMNWREIVEAKMVDWFGHDNET